MVVRCVCCGDVWRVVVCAYILCQCIIGTVLEIGDGWASNDSRRWNGEYKRFALYTEPKSADEVAAMYAAAFQTSGGGGGGGSSGGGGH